MAWRIRGGRSKGLPRPCAPYFWCLASQLFSASGDKGEQSKTPLVLRLLWRWSQ